MKLPKGAKEEYELNLDYEISKNYHIPRSKGIIQDFEQYKKQFVITTDPTKNPKPKHPSLYNFLHGLEIYLSKKELGTTDPVIYLHFLHYEKREKMTKIFDWYKQQGIMTYQTRNALSKAIPKYLGFRLEDGNDLNQRDLEQAKLNGLKASNPKTYTIKNTTSKVKDIIQEIDVIQNCDYKTYNEISNANEKLCFILGKTDTKLKNMIEDMESIFNKKVILTVISTVLKKFFILNNIWPENQFTYTKSDLEDLQKK